ncbi:MAG TPA: Clp protease N-terminal domain-containing protein, partial [Gemmataceae bacterium]|nr:Clp protease N-terminal domain-containing protein [Gemmataceae bacterium]
DEARHLSHNYVGTEHLLLGLLREGDNVAAQVLLYLGLKLEDVREEVLNLLGHNMPDPPTAAFLPPLPMAAAVPLTDAELNAVGTVITQLDAQKEQAIIAHDFHLAASFRDRADAVKKLLRWYRGFNGDS